MAQELPLPADLSFSELPWEARFAGLFPGDPEAVNFTRPVSEITHSVTSPTAVRAPTLLAWSDRLATELGIKKSESGDSLALLAGNLVLPSMRPYAARYGGHQFGHWAGQLGDGRAITLGEVETKSGRREFQLKGAGPTPYSRRADGRAVLRSSVREFLCSEAMHFLGVPTTRALALVGTGEAVVRDLFYDGNPREEPGAIVTRVSPSFLRFGNFQILAATGETDLLRDLTDFLIADHFPNISPVDPDRYGLLLDEVGRRTARLMIEWMRVGFVHGVMNTDNMAVLGLTIDYGPYGWLEPYDPGWTPNTTDSEGRRYCYGNQPGIGHWNFARLCEALQPLIGDESRLKRSLELYREIFEREYPEMIARKLGVTVPVEAAELTAYREEIEMLFGLLQSSEADMTLFFRGLSTELAGAEDFLGMLTPTLYRAAPLTPELDTAWRAWFSRYRARLIKSGLLAAERIQSMRAVNPKFVLRNYLAQNAIVAAESGDATLIARLLRVLEFPYDENPSDQDLAEKRPEWARSAPGCSALSCSS